MENVLVQGCSGKASRLAAPPGRASWPRRLAEAADRDEPVLSEEDCYRAASGEIRVAASAVTAVKNGNDRRHAFL